MPTTFTPDEVTIREVAPTRVAMFEHRGDPETLDVTIHKFIAWHKAAGLSPKTNPAVNIWHTERRPTNLADYRLEVCVGVDADQFIDPADETVREGEIPGGPCAMLRVTGDTQNLESAAMYLYRNWLPVSGEEMRDFPIHCQRFFLAEPEQGTAAELHLPLKSRTFDLSYSVATSSLSSPLSL